MAALNPYHAIIKVEIRAAKDLKDTDIAGKSDPYAKISFAEHEGVPRHRQTHVIKDTLNPVWNSTMYFLVSDECKAFKVELFDEDIGRDDKLGHVNVLRKDHSKRYIHDGEWYYLEKGKGGTIQIFTQEIDISAGIDGILDEKKEAVAASRGSPTEEFALLQVWLHRAEGLKKADFFGSSDPYCKFDFGLEGGKEKCFPKDVKTKIIEKSLNPVWESVFHFFVPWDMKAFRVNIYDYDKASADDLIGHSNLIIKDMGVRVDKLELAVEKKGKLVASYVKVPLGILFK